MIDLWFLTSGVITLRGTLGYDYYTMNTYYTRTVGEGACTTIETPTLSREARSDAQHAGVLQDQSKCDAFPVRRPGCVSSQGSCKLLAIILTLTTPFIFIYITVCLAVSFFFNVSHVFEVRHAPSHRQRRLLSLPELQHQHLREKKKEKKKRRVGIIIKKISKHHVKRKETELTSSIVI